MTDDDESYRTDGGHPSWGANPRIGKTPDAEANKIAEESYRNITGNPNQKPVIESYDKECQDFTPFPNDCCGFHECIQKDCVYHPDAEKGNPVPSSTELIAMANLEWRNREERRGIHNREDWCCGWMAGFLTEKKPNWGKEQIGAAKSSARKEMAKIISEILDREWMCDLNEIKYILDCVANGNSDPFKDRPGTGGNPP